MSRFFIISLIVAVALVILGAAISFDFFEIDSAIKNSIQNGKKHTIIVGEKDILVEIADTMARRTQGLSGRETLPENEGLLFVFKETGKHPFWMRDMRFPIDIIWINEHFVVVDVTENINPATFPEIFEPMELIRYVLETNAGWVKQNNITRGTEVSGIGGIR